MRFSVRRLDVCPGEEKHILRKSAFCARTLTKGRTPHASGGCAESPFSPICVHSCVPTAARATGRDART